MDEAVAHSSMRSACARSAGAARSRRNPSGQPSSNSSTWRWNQLGTSSYLFAGPMTYASHEGERPIAITWRLRHALRTDFYDAASVVAR
jgi:hypothetical protein